MAKLTTFGFDELERDLKALESRASKLSKGVPLREVCNSKFIKKHTKFESIDAFMEAAGGKLNADGDSWSFEDDVDLDSFVFKESRFRTWEEMQSAAVKHYL